MQRHENEKMRAAWEQGIEVLYRRLQQVDPEAAARILPGNLRRIIRALEVYEVTGIPFSRQQGKEPPPCPFCLLGLTMERPALYQRVDRRAEDMVQQGLVQEVRDLLDRGYDWDLPAMSGLGYKQVRPHLEEGACLEEALERIQYDTHAFIRRQYTWFRRFSVQRWFDAGLSEELSGVLAYVREWLFGQVQ